MKKLKTKKSKQLQYEYSGVRENNGIKNIMSNCSEQIINTCQLPKDVLLGAVVISMTGNREILIENFKNIVKYEAELLIIQCKNNRIQIKGRNLSLAIYTKEELKVCGYISEIKFL